MSQGDRHANRRRSKREAEPSPLAGEGREREPHGPVSAPAPLAGALDSALSTSSSACLWLLPAGQGEYWPVGETDPTALSEALAAGRASILVPQLNTEDEKEIHQRAREYVLRAFNPRLHDRLFAFLSRALLAGAWLLVALVGLRLFPGWVKELDALLLLLGGAFLLYSIVRYGLPAARLHYLRVDALQAFSRADVIPSPLAGRLAKALSLRRTLPPQERGKSPDDELLDAKAYRKLISEGVTTRAELCALGRSIAAALKLDSPDSDSRKFADLAREAGLDTETAIFYRDLAAAAREISLESEWA